MMNTEFISQICLGDTANLASMIIPLPCPVRLSAPRLTIPLINYTTTTPTRIAISLTGLTETYRHTFLRAIANLSSYSIWLAIKNFVTYWASKIFAKAPLRSWSRRDTFETTKPFVRVCPIIRKLLATIGTFNYFHSYIITKTREYVKSYKLLARGIE